nr:AI-2E family transporter [Oculatella sp. LEGE 06141]
MAVAVALYILWQIRQILLLLFTAVVLATALNQMVERFERSRVRRPWSVFLTITIVISILVLVVWLIVPAFIDQFRQSVELFPIAVTQIELGLSWLERSIFGRFLPDLPDVNVNQWIDRLQPLGSQVLQQTFDFFSTSLNATLQFLLVVVLVLMLLSNPHPYRQGFVRLFPAFYRDRVDHILLRCQSSLGDWSIGALIEMVFVAALSGLGLWILRVPLVLAHALLAGLLNFIPNIGPTLSAVLPISIALLDSPWKALAVLVLYIVIQQIESYWLTPTVMAKQVALLPAVTLTAQIIFANLFGVLGLLVALPLTVVAKTWISELVFKDILDPWQRPPRSADHSPPDLVDRN